MVNKFVEKAFDEILDIVISGPKQDLIDYMNQNKRQKILIKSLESLSNSSFLKTEFSGVKADLDKDFICNLNDEIIAPNLKFEKLTDNLRDVVKNSVMVDEQNDISRIAEWVAKDYIIRSKATLELFDLLSSQQEGVEMIMKETIQIKEINRINQSILISEIKNINENINEFVEYQSQFINNLDQFKEYDYITLRVSESVDESIIDLIDEKFDFCIEYENDEDEKGRYLNLNFDDSIEYETMKELIEEIYSEFKKEKIKIYNIDFE